MPDKVFGFYLFGDIRVICGGFAQPSPPHRIHSLLAALLLHSKSLRREHLLGLLFPDLPERVGRSRLSDLLWLLRRSLPDLDLQTNSQEIFLPPKTRWLDVEAFQDAAAQTDLDAWMGALSLYQGNLLDGLHDDWLVEERETLYLQYIHLAHRTCNELLRQQRFDQVLPVIERLVQAEPYDEAALRTLMKVYQGLGRRGAALAAYERFLNMATKELGVEPEVATSTLAQSLHDEGVSALQVATSLPEQASPEMLLQQAHQAASCGDAPVLQNLLTRLHTCSAFIDPKEIYLLEIDRALCADDYELATQLLETCPTRSAATLVRQARLAFHQHRESEAQDLASEALIISHDAGDQQTELDALLILSQAQRRCGQGVQSSRSAEQALKLARALGSPMHIAQALKSKGYTLNRQGRDAEALSVLREMRSLAHERNLRVILAEALRGIAAVYSDRCAWLDALSTYQEELSIWRDIGLPGREVQTLHNLAIVQAQLGRLPECLHTLETAHQICEQLCDPIELAINQYNLADTLIHSDDANAPQAVTVANQALEIFRCQQQPAWEAAASATLGCAFWIQDQHQTALDAFCQARDLYEQVGELPFLAEMLAYQALAHLGLGQIDQALVISRRAVLSLAQGEGFEESIPTIYYAHAQALEANGQTEQARDYLERIYRHLLTGAAKLDDEPARQAFFTNHCITRRVMQQLHAYGIAPMPATGVITKQLSSLQTNRMLPVRLTLDAGPVDAALKQSQGAIGLRRARLARLLQEARSQGAKPTLRELADILNVSVRTIKRDLAVLRQEQ